MTYPDLEVVDAYYRKRYTWHSNAHFQVAELRFSTAHHGLRSHVMRPPREIAAFLMQARPNPESLASA